MCIRFAYMAFYLAYCCYGKTLTKSNLVEKRNLFLLTSYSPPSHINGSQILRSSRNLKAGIEEGIMVEHCVLAYFQAHLQMHLLRGGGEGTFR